MMWTGLQQVSERMVLAQKAYILFYIRAPTHGKSHALAPAASAAARSSAAPNGPVSSSSNPVSSSSAQTQEKLDAAAASVKLEDSMRACNGGLHRSGGGGGGSAEPHRKEEPREHKDEKEKHLKRRFQEMLEADPAPVGLPPVQRDGAATSAAEATPKLQVSGSA